MPLKHYRIFCLGAKARCTAAICLCTLAGILLYPQAAANGVREGLLLCARVVIPALFPFTVAVLLLFKTGLFASRQGGGFWRCRCGVFLLSLLAGYPVGARLVRALYQKGYVSRPQAQTMVCYCQNAGPAFVVIAVGVGVYGRSDAGWLLLAAHVSAACLLCFLLEKCHVKEERPTHKATNESFSFGEAFVAATAEASGAMFSVCGWVTLFSALGTLLAAAPLPQELLLPLRALAEVTTGLATAKPFGLCAVAALLGFGGFCVHFQVLSGAGEVRPPIGKFLLCRAVHGLLSALCMQGLLAVFPLKQATATFGQAPAALGNAASVPAALSLLFLCVVFLCSVKQKQALRK